MSNYIIVLSYDGWKFNGWQKQRNTKNTIQAKLEAVLESFAGYPVEIQGAGRTDRGVHAKGQTASFRLRTDESCEIIRNYMNQNLPETIAILSISKVTERFHARLNAKAKTYVYRLWDGDVPNVFQRHYIWQCRELTGRVDIDLLNRRLAELKGERDFKDFSRYTGNKSTIRTVYEAFAVRKGNLIEIVFRGNGFLYNQVRMMTGWALTGEKYTAPARGLCLENVEYNREDIGEK